MDGNNPPLIRALRNPTRYPHFVDRVDLVETHISWVLLAGEFAYKIKKPLTLPFLDYGTLDKRRAFCAAELRLNRRFAPQLYLDVVEFDGEPAVKMRRFDEAARLDHVCKRGALKPEHLSGLAALLARFHGAADVAPDASRFGTPAAVLDAALENFTELRSLTGAVFTAELDALEAWTRREFTQREAAFTARKAGACIRECHGDLHLGNMVLLDEAAPPLGRPEAARHAGEAGNGTDTSTERPVTNERSEPQVSPSGRRGLGGGGQQVIPFDCIEFNEDFRWIDVASEIAFTLVDLLDHDQPGLATWLLNEWLTETGDYAALDVLRFYMAYRALVRAKVAAIRACQQKAPNAVAAADCPEVHDYLALAQKIGVSPAPTFTITCGVSGSGKTALSSARLLAEPHATTIRLRSDVERKRLFGLARHASSGSGLDAGIYTAEATTRTYARLAELAESLLEGGWSVIVDAACLKRAERTTFHAIALRHNAPFAILAGDAAPDELRRRVAARRGDASEATLAVLEKQFAWIEPLDAAERALSVGS